MKKPIAVDLFCGAGGMSEGILQAGFHIAFSSDKSPEASLTYQYRHEQLGLKNGYNTFFCMEDIANLTGKFILNSISNLEYFKNRFNGKVDVIFGGPPCQGFSRAGKRLKNDPRNLLFREYLRVIAEIRPNYVVMENVVGLLDTSLDNFISYDGEKYSNATLVTEILVKEFFKIGYKIKNSDEHGKIDSKKIILNASDFGVPQKRERVIIIAYKENQNQPRDIDYYKVNKIVTVEEAISDLIVNKNKRKYQLEKLKEKNKLDYINSSKKGRTKNFFNNETIKNNFNQNTELSLHLPYVKERFSLYKQGESSKDVKARLMSEGIEKVLELDALLQYTYENSDYASLDELKLEIANFLKKSKTDKEKLLNIILSKKNIRTRLMGEEVARTIVTLPDDYISPFEERVFSVREMARLQSFDDSFIFLGKRTTGGERRKMEIPQYTQVGNAVPPLLARAIAKSIIDVIT